jgi:phytoene/squalene synthetase
MMNFTNDEMNLMCIYDTGSRTGLINALSEMRKELDADEVALRELTDSVLNKLSAMADEDYEQLELYPDFDE